MSGIGVGKQKCPYSDRTCFLVEKETDEKVAPVSPCCCSAVESWAQGSGDVGGAMIRPGREWQPETISSIFNVPHRLCPCKSTALAPVLFRWVLLVPSPIFQWLPSSVWPVWLQCNSPCKEGCIASFFSYYLNIPKWRSGVQILWASQTSGGTPQVCTVAAARSQCRLAGVAEDTLVPVSKDPGLRCCPFQAVLSAVVPSDSYFPMTVRVKYFAWFPKLLITCWMKM